MTEGGKNYKLDELIGYYLIYLHYIINPTNPNLSNLPILTIKIKKTKGLLKTEVLIFHLAERQVQYSFVQYLDLGQHNLKQYYNTYYNIYHRYLL